MKTKEEIKKKLKTMKQGNIEEMENIENDMGSFDIDGILGESNRLDVKKLGKIPCKICVHKFNPFYNKSLTPTKSNFMRIIKNHEL